MQFNREKKYNRVYPSLLGRFLWSQKEGVLDSVDKFSSSTDLKIYT